MSKGKFAIGALIGAAIGAAAGILTAPKSGKETREDLKKKADSVKADAEKKAGEAAEGAKDLKRRAGNAVEGAKKGFKEDK